MHFGIESSRSALRDYDKDFKKEEKDKSATLRCLSTATTLTASEASSTEKSSTTTTKSNSDSRKDRFYETLSTYLSLK